MRRRSACAGGTGGGGAGAAGAGGSGGEGPAQLGEACGTGDCDTGLFCDFPYHACTYQPPGVTGDAYSSGACAARPEGCAHEGPSSPVCGCDGVVYASACRAYLASIDLGHESCGPEVTPAGLFPCGTLYCDPNAEWCWVGLGARSSRAMGSAGCAWRSR